MDRAQRPISDPRGGVELQHGICKLRCEEQSVQRAQLGPALENKVLERDGVGKHRPAPGSRDSLEKKPATGQAGGVGQVVFVAVGVRHCAKCGSRYNARLGGHGVSRPWPLTRKDKMDCVMERRKALEAESRKENAASGSVEDGCRPFPFRSLALSFGGWSRHK